MDVWLPSPHRRSAAAPWPRSEVRVGSRARWRRDAGLAYPVRVALPDEAAYGAFMASHGVRLRRILGLPDMPYLFTFKRTRRRARFDEQAPR